MKVKTMHHVVSCDPWGVVGTTSFEALDSALAFLDLRRQCGDNWGKCFTVRSDGRYVFESEFQQRT